MNNPFSKLIRPKGQLDEETQKRLANLLEPYVWLDPDSDSIVFKEASSSLSALQKILVFAISRKAMSLINEKNKGSFSPSEVESETQTPGGTVRPKLAELIKKKILVKTSDGYELSPNFFISEIEQILGRH